MHIDLASIPWASVVGSALSFAALGGLWFGLVVARTYAAALERPDIVGVKPSTLAIAGPFVCGVVVTVTNALLLPAVGTTTLGGAAGLGAVVGIGYLTPMVVNIAINPSFPRPFLYSAITAPYFVVGNVVSCLVLEAGR